MCITTTIYVSIPGWCRVFFHHAARHSRLLAARVATDACRGCSGGPTDDLVEPRGGGRERRAERGRVPPRSAPVRVARYTADVDRAGVREVVGDVRHGGHSLAVFLAPTVLYEPDTLADIEGATERYRDFESFRRDLVGIADVSAYEVPPRSRLEAVPEERRATVGE